VFSANELINSSQSWISSSFDTKGWTKIDVVHLFDLGTTTSRKAIKREVTTFGATTVWRKYTMRKMIS
jgi:hypothetical protein